MASAVESANEWDRLLEKSSVMVGRWVPGCRYQSGAEQPGRQPADADVGTPGERQEVEWAPLTCVDEFNYRRIRSEIGMIPGQRIATTVRAAPTSSSVHGLTHPAHPHTSL
jgi:hypothetical protein